MFKRKITKFFSIIAIGALLTSSIASESKVKASGLTEKEVSINYLTAIKNKDVNEIVKLSRSAMVSNTDAYKRQVEEMLSNPNNHLKSFEILDSVEKEADMTTLQVRLEYINGTIEEMPIRLKNAGDKPVVWLGTESIDVNTIVEGEKIPVITPRVQLNTWDVTVESQDPFKYSGVFSATSASYVDLNYKQNGPTKFVVVKNLWIGHSEVSYTASRGNNWSTGPDSVILNLIPGKSFDNVKLLIIYDGGSLTYSFGEIYAY